jgi:hypothetical protein
MTPAIRGEMLCLRSGVAMKKELVFPTFRATSGRDGRILQKDEAPSSLRPDDASNRTTR